MNTQDLQLEFTGSGREYFRIWIVNLLLILVSLTLYWPYARARRLRYFQNHTLVGGEPLGFHGDPRKMFRGYLVVVLLIVVYSALGHFLPQLAWLSTALLAASAPLLWQAAMRFRLHNTSWRGIRFHFDGAAQPAYWVLVPFFVPLLASDLLLGLLPETESGEGLLTFLAYLLLGLLVFGSLAPWFFWRLKLYQYGGYGFMQERLQLQAGVKAFYRIFLKTAWLGVYVSVLGVGGILLIFGLLSLGGDPGSITTAASTLFLVLLGFLTPALYLLWPIVLGPYFTAQMQNLLWSHSRSERLHFSSDLRFKDLCRVSLRNWLLILCSLGLYWPFARVNLARVRLAALTVHVPDDLDTWLAEARPADQSAIGDAADDFMGLDIGL